MAANAVYLKTLGRIVSNCNRYSFSYSQTIPIVASFKTTTLVYKFLHSGHPPNFSPLLPICCGGYGTRYNHPDKSFLEVPQYYSSVHK